MEKGIIINELRKNIVKKKAVFSLKDLKINLDKNKINDNEYIIKYTSNFDLDSQMNFEFFKNKNNLEFLKKYKYSLNYSDAKKLNCFEANEDRDLIIQLEEKLKNFKIEHKIDHFYFAKYKLIDLLLYLFSIDYYRIGNKIDEVKNKIRLYKPNCSLIFKSPINFGNIELKYYFYLNLFCEYFLVDENIKENQHEKLIFFHNIDIDHKEIDCDLTDFEKRKNELLKYIQNNVNKESNNKKDMEKEKEIKLNYDDYDSTMQCEKKRINKKKVHHHDEFNEEININQFDNNINVNINNINVNITNINQADINNNNTNQNNINNNNNQININNDQINVNKQKKKRKSGIL